MVCCHKQASQARPRKSTQTLNAAYEQKRTDKHTAARVALSAFAGAIYMRMVCCCCSRHVRFYHSFAQADPRVHTRVRCDAIGRSECDWVRGTPLLPAS